ncbi:MAG: hypothetical protein CVT67_11490 [Actinobacteria bacterium HGW-Actinobacteria-7]|jgi:signal transduction histidine kinase/MFS family permease|nr:MAG: hypothetical protein CVT67_11490 [Actinobacteria bacterium HGW-Actinobacteria-7]
MDLFRLAVTATVGAANIGIALAVYLRNRRHAANRAFAAAVSMIVVWLTLAFLSDQVMFRSQALFLNRLTLGTAVLMGVCVVYFATVFPRATGQLNLMYRIFLGFGVLIAAVTAFTPLVVTDVVPLDWGTDVVDGPLIWLMAAWLLVATAALGVGLVTKYRRAEDREKAQLKYLFVGLALFAGVSLAFGLVLPLITGSWEFSTLNAFASLLLVGFASYAMVKHRFMDIRMIVLRGTTYTLLVSLLGLVLAGVAAVARAELTDRLGLNPDAIFVVAALAAILAFQPVRTVLERFTDGMFYRRTYDPQALLSSLGASMAITLDLNALEYSLSRELCSGMRLTRVAVAHVRAGEIEIIGAPEDFVSESELRSLINARAGALVFSDDPNTDSTIAALLERLHVRVLVPLVGGDAILGAILLGPKMSGEMFSTQDAQFLETLGREASISFRNALLFEDRNQRVRELSSLSALAWALGGDRQLGSILDEALDEVMQVTDAEAGSIMLLQRDGETLAIESARGLPREVVDTTRIRLGEGIAGWVAQNRKPLALIDTPDTGFGDLLQREGLRSALSVPLAFKGRVIGVLNVSKATSTEAFSDENLRVVSSFAGQLAVAIENAKLEIDVGSMFDSLQQTRKEFTETQDFFAKASHELRTPLNSIIGFGTLLRTGAAGALNDEQQRQADMILSSGKRLLALVNDLLDLEKLSTEKDVLDLGPCDVDAIVADCISVVEPLAAEKGLNLKVDCGEVGSIRADTRRIEQAVLNLLSNAVKFTDRGFVRVRTSLRDGLVVVSVSDSGRGIAPDLLPHVFDEFVSGTSAANGTGLGLAITRQVAQRHGGTITVTSKPGLGTRFELCLPLDAVERVERSESASLPNVTAAPARGHLRAL